MSGTKAILIGHGHLGKWHAQKLAASTQCDFVGIIEPLESKHEELRSIYPGIEIAASLTNFKTDFEAAVVATPTSFHFEVCKQLLQMNKHIFCEKPVTETYEQAQELFELKRNHPGVIFQVGHSERFHLFFEPEFVREVSEYLTGPALFRLERQAPFKGRATDVDVVSDLMIHDIDLLLFLTGKRPKSVRAHGFKTLTQKWDQASATFQFEGGSEATIVVSRTYIKEVRYFEAISPLGTLHYDLKDEKRIIFNKDGGLTEQEFSRRDHLLIEQQKFFESIQKASAEVVDLPSGMNAVYLVGKVLESIDTKQELSL